MNLSVHHPDVNVPVLWWRSVGATHTAYVMETLVDEIAFATKQDPVAYRMKLMEGNAKADRHRAALQAAVDKSGYGKRKLKARPGLGRGPARELRVRRRLCRRGQHQGQGQGPPAGAAGSACRRALQSLHQPQGGRGPGAGRRHHGPGHDDADPSRDLQGRCRSSRTTSTTWPCRASPMRPSRDDGQHRAQQRPAQRAWASLACRPWRRHSRTRSHA